MLQGIVHFVIYVFLAGVSGSVFKWAAGLIEGLFVFLIYGILSGFKGFDDDGNPRYHKRFVFNLVTKNVFIGTLNAIMIFTVTAEFLQRTGANLWLYMALSVFWSLLIHGYFNSYHLMYFMTSTVTLVLFWFGLGAFGWILVAPLTLLISLAYYMGRVDMVIENQGYTGEQTF